MRSRVHVEEDAELINLLIQKNYCGKVIERSIKEFYIKGRK